MQCCNLQYLWVEEKPRRTFQRPRPASRTLEEASAIFGICGERSITTLLGRRKSEDNNKDAGRGQRPHSAIG